MSSVHEKHARLQWVDVLRGILILAVVIGHATGKYNQYIYQFHMGAFFILSGLISVPERRTVANTVFYKFFTNYLPLLSSIVLFSVVSEILSYMGLYPRFFNETAPHLGMWKIIHIFLFEGMIYSWLLGAAWFLLVLFGATIINRILLEVCNKKYNIIFVVLSLVVFLWGYSLSKEGEHKYNFDLMLIAQFYIMLGECLRLLIEGKKHDKPFMWDIIGLLINGVIMMCLSKHNLSMDFSARRFNHPATDILLIINGTMFCYFLAMLCCRQRLLKNTLQDLGKNTLPIVIFHFATFKIGYFILFLFGVVPLSYLDNFVPTIEIGNTWWPLITFISIATSMPLWKMMMHFRTGRILWGQEKKVYDTIWKTLSKKLYHTFSFLIKKV